MHYSGSPRYTASRVGNRLISRDQRQSGRVTFWSETTMSNPYLPPEILDYVVDLLYDYPNVLERCCLVSKSWIPRTRKHLFAEIRLHDKKDLESWKTVFPDPSTCPAYFTKSLHVGCARAVTAADAEPGGWLTGFSHIVHLGVETEELYPGESPVSLVPFHGFSPVIKSLHLGSIDLPPSRIFNFVLSSPLLEDLTVSCHGIPEDDGDSSDGPATVDQPSNTPLFTGSLELPPLCGGLAPIAGRLLSMPGGIHSRKLVLGCFCEEDLLLARALVGECSHTLESLNITCFWLRTSIRCTCPHR